MKIIKPLLVIFQFRILSDFLEAARSLTTDKLKIRFYPQREAYSLARDEFLKRDEYTHFVLLTDDVVVKQEDIDLLLKDVQKYGFDVISGWFNGNITTHKDDSNISMSLPFDPPSASSYESYKFVKIADLGKLAHISEDKNIIPVKHQGTALTVLSREIVDKIPFRHSGGCCIDSCLSLDLDKAGITQYVDLRVRCYHLKVDDATQAKISMVDKLPREIKYAN